MSLSTTATISASVAWNQTELVGNSSIRDIGEHSVSLDFTTGSGSKQINSVWHDKLSLPSGGQINYDLQSLSRELLGGSYTSSFGRVRVLSINNQATKPGATIRVAATGTNGFVAPFGNTSGSIEIPASGMQVFMNTIDGYTVDGNNKDIQLFDEGGSGALFEVVVVGVSGI